MVTGKFLDSLFNSRRPSLLYKDYLPQTFCDEQPSTFVDCTFRTASLLTATRRLSWQIVWENFIFHPIWLEDCVLMVSLWPFPGLGSVETTGTDLVTIGGVAAEICPAVGFSMWFLSRPFSLQCCSWRWFSFLRNLLGGNCYRFRLLCLTLIRKMAHRWAVLFSKGSRWES